ncbi:MAG: sensor histidine kinase [bacterium]
MKKLNRLIHPIVVFVVTQLAWVSLVVLWIYWYFSNRSEFIKLAREIDPSPLSGRSSLLFLIGGIILLTGILIGISILFVNWSKQKKLIQTQSNFISNVTHEFKSPLASLQLHLETLSYQSCTEEEKLKFVDTMLADISRLSSLIDNVLDVAKLEKKFKYTFEPRNLKTFMEGYIKSQASLIEESGLQVKSDFQEGITVSINPSAMHIVFNNLLNNALKYSGKSKQVTLKSYREGNWGRIDFSDQGIGIEKKEYKKIFSKFYRIEDKLKRAPGGTGLGLFIVKSLLLLHKGKVSVHSAGPGKGTTFSLLLPLTNPSIVDNE